MANYKELSSADIKSSRSVLNQLVDFPQSDISGSSTRKKYQVFVTGGIGPGVTSSLFQTIFDQDFTLQTANPTMDMTVGLYISSSVVMNSSSSIDSAGKILFPSESLMMREKINVYRQFAQLLRGDAGLSFAAPLTSTSATDVINNALFFSVKRLFSRDKLKRETLGMRIYATGAYCHKDEDYSGPAIAAGGQDNVHITSITGSKIITDLGAAANKARVAYGGEWGTLVDASNTSNKVGLVFYDKGIAVLDIDKVFSGSQQMSGTISAMATSHTYNGATIPAGKVVLGATGYGNSKAKLVPDLLVSASIDDIVDYFASTRFQSGTLTAMTFQNQTNINSTLIFCRAPANEFNYSSNPTFTDSSNRIVVIEDGQENVQRTFTMPTGIGLYDAAGDLLAVAKFSRPIEKNDERDISFRVRLDF